MEILKKTEIQVGIITILGVCLTIIGSIIATNLTNNGQIDKQRIEAVRQMKRTYYNQLAEAYTKKLMYSNKPISIEKVESEVYFLEESARLPLYASQEMIEFIEMMKNPEIANKTEIKDFYKIMREDLCSDNFEEFDDSLEMSMSIPDRVVVTDIQGDKKIQNSQ